VQSPTGQSGKAARCDAPEDTPRSPTRDPGAVSSSEQQPIEPIAETQPDRRKDQALAPSEPGLASHRSRLSQAYARGSIPQAIGLCRAGRVTTGFGVSVRRRSRLDRSIGCSRTQRDAHIRCSQRLTPALLGGPTLPTRSPEVPSEPLVVNGAAVARHHLVAARPPMMAPSGGSRARRATPSADMSVAHLLQAPGQSNPRGTPADHGRITGIQRRRSLSQQ